MKRLPLGIALATGTLLLAACGQTDPEADAAANTLLRYVPADTPFVLANLEPVPADVVDAYIDRMAPVLAQFETALGGFREDIESGNTDLDDPRALAVAEAVLAEFEGKLDRQGMESLGLSLEQISAAYGHGLFPVMRVGLGDPVKVRAMIDRVQARSGVEIPEFDHQGQAYWKAADPESPMALFIAIIDDHVAFAAAPDAESQAFLPVFLGQELPDTSLAASGALGKLNRDKSFEPYGSGYLDLSRVVDELFDPNSQTAAWMARMGDFDPAAVDPACEREARLVTTFVPRIVAGTTEVTANAVGMRYQVETNPLLGGQLAGLVGDVPPAGSDPSRMATFSMNLQMGRVTEFLRNSANAMAAVPFQCPQLQDLNQQVQQLAQNLNQPMPPFIGNLKGMRAEFSEFDAANPSPERMRGLVSLEMESPQMVIGMASMMIPGFEELQIEPGADPVEVPRELMTVVTPEFEVYAVMGKSAIGISLGRGESDGLRAFLDQDGDVDDVFLSLEYDGKALARMQRQSIAAYEEAARQDTSLAAPDDQAGEVPGDIDLEALAADYEALLGRTRFEFRFDGEGLTIDNRQTFD
jgi:hypothetical protein